MATFACVASGLPRPTITWTDPDGNTLVSGKNNVNIIYYIFVPTNENLISIVQLYMTTASVSGLYICAVDNGIDGGDNTSVGVYLTVHSK